MNNIPNKVMCWRFSLDDGEFAASCPAVISADEVGYLLEFIDLMRRSISRLGQADAAVTREREAEAVETQ